MPVVLRQREFRLLFCGQSISLLGDGMVNVALAFAVLQVSRSPAAVGLVLAARTLPLVASLLAGGVVADRVSRRAVMVVSDIVRLASHGTMAGLLIAHSASVGSLALLAGAAGAATGFFSPASTGLLPLIVEPADLQSANGLRTTAKAFGEIAGPIAAGLLVATAGAGWALGIDAATFAVSAGFLVALRLPARVDRARTSFAVDLRDGWREFRSRRWVWTFIAAAAVGNVLWAAWMALGPVVAQRHLGGAPAWGVVLAAAGLGGLAGGLAAMRARPRRPLVVASLGLAVFGTPLALLAAGVPVAILAVGAFVSGAGVMLADAVWESTLQQRIPTAALSRVSAWDWFGSLAFRPIGLAVWGPIAASIGVGTALWIAFGLQAVMVVALLAVRDVRGLTADGPEATEPRARTAPPGRPAAPGRRA